MSLKEEVDSLPGAKRKYILYRVSGFDKHAAIQLTKIKEGTYNSWLNVTEFVAVHQRLPELSKEYRYEAIRLLRRDNQQAAVILEEKIMEKMIIEIETGKHSLIRSRLGQDVYNKLMSDVDAAPQSVSLTWEQRLAQLNFGTAAPDNLLPDGQTVEGEIVESSQS